MFKSNVHFFVLVQEIMDFNTHSQILSSLQLKSNNLKFLIYEIVLTLLFLFL